MSLGENIHAAFEIVAETYENVSKLMSYCQEKAGDNEEFVLSSPKFLRWKSDNDVRGWLMQSFILLFQNSKDKLLKNQWRDGPVYVMEINFNPELYNEPMVNIAKFEYDNMSSWSEGVSPAAHDIFYDPLYGNFIDFEGDEFSYSGDVSDEYISRYWGLRRIVGIGVPIVEVTRESVKDRLFGGFRSLIDK